jgi:hypothetical protein
MKRILEQRGFDVAGIKETEFGPVTGYVVTTELQEAPSAHYVKAFDPEHLISDATPLAQVLVTLRSREHVFVVIGAGVKGIITRADLNKPPVRIYLFALISLLEMHLRFWVRASYQGDSWQAKLKENRLAAARSLHEIRRERNDQISLLDCLQFCDLRDLIVAIRDVRSKLDLGGKNKSIELLKDAEELRNRLAHSQEDLVEGKSLIDLIEKIEKIVGLSDDAVELQSQKKGNTHTLLWMAG